MYVIRCSPCLPCPVADPGIDKRGGADFFKKIHTPQPVSYALEGSGGMKSKAQMKHCRSYFGSNMAVFLFLGP